MSTDTDNYKEIAFKLAIYGSNLLHTDNKDNSQQSKEFIEYCKKLSDIFYKNKVDISKASYILTKLGYVPTLGVTESDDMLGITLTQKIYQNLKDFIHKWNEAESNLNNLILDFNDTGTIEKHQLIDYYNAITDMLYAGKGAQDKIKSLLKEK